jgi:hypothetical protein
MNGHTIRLCLRVDRDEAQASHSFSKINSKSVNLERSFSIITYKYIKTEERVRISHLAFSSSLWIAFETDKTERERGIFAFWNRKHQNRKANRKKRESATDHKKNSFN